MVAPAPGVEAPTLVPIRAGCPRRPCTGARESARERTRMCRGADRRRQGHQDPTPTNATDVTNLADQIELDMRDRLTACVFTSQPAMADIATYTHGMIRGQSTRHTRSARAANPMKSRRGPDEEDGLVSAVHVVHACSRIPAELDSPWQWRIMGPACRLTRWGRPSPTSSGSSATSTMRARTLPGVAEDGASRSSTTRISRPTTGQAAMRCCAT